MYVVRPDEMAAIDKRAINEKGIPGIVLMENAALKIIKHVNHMLEFKKGSILVFSGPGNNGGDGLAVARHLHLTGNDVTVILTASPNNLPPDTRLNYNILINIGVKIITVLCDEDIEPVLDHIFSASIIIDGLFGTGLSREVKGRYNILIDLINRSDAKVISIDIPSGTNGYNGKVLGATVKADHTVTFGFAKIGHLLYPGRQMTGNLHIEYIGFPDDSIDYYDIDRFYLSFKEACSLLKTRPLNSHKGTFGKVGVIGGSKGMTGAPCLTSLAALRAGSGLVTLAGPKSLLDTINTLNIEIMTYLLEDEGLGDFKVSCIESIDEFISNKDCIALGPGMGKSYDIIEIIRHILMENDICIVVDADGLNNISEDINILKETRCKTILTPHPGEMANLTGLETAAVLDNPAEIALDFAYKYNTIVLLKGATTVIAAPDGRLCYNLTGNSGMATAGSGDVLTGIISSLVGQGYDPFICAVLGAYVHGKSGDLAAEAKGFHGMIASDIIDVLPVVLRDMYTNSMKNKLQYI